MINLKDSGKLSRVSISMLLYLGSFLILIALLLLIEIPVSNDYYKYLVLLSIFLLGFNVINYLLIAGKSPILRNILGVAINLPAFFFTIWVTGGYSSRYWVILVPFVIAWGFFFVSRWVYYTVMFVIMTAFFYMTWYQIGGVFTATITIDMAAKMLTILFIGLWVKSLVSNLKKEISDNIVDLKNKNQQSQQLLSSFIKTLSAAIARKDIFIQKHSQRVIEYCMAVAESLKLSEPDKEKLYLAALLHDIGKMSISDMILKKKGKLSKEEFDIIRYHPLDAISILENVDEFKNVLIFIKYHHERHDGKGYPEGLKGDTIPLLARILILANAFDAMTSDRIYAKRLNKEEAIAELKNNRGTQFDPKLVDIFMEIIKDKKTIGPM